jgi:hypothetical protein
MEYLEHENRVLWKEMAAMQTKMDEMNELMKTPMAAQNQPPPPPPYQDSSRNCFYWL